MSTAFTARSLVPCGGQSRPGLLHAQSSEETTTDDGVETRPLFGGATGCRTFEQRLLRFSAASSPRSAPRGTRCSSSSPGNGRATMGDDSATLEPETAVFVARGTSWQMNEADDLELLSVLVHDPLPGTSTHAVVDVQSQEAGAATAGRMFQLLAGPDVGCASVTQFLGRIPVVRAPDHFHTLRRGRVRAPRTGRIAHRRRERRRCRRVRRFTSPRGSCTASRTPGPARCRCSVSSARPAHRPRRTTRTERRRQY